MKWIAGLGNPGRKYEGTRHNVGFMAVDAMAERWGIDWRTNTRCRALIGEGRTGDGEEVVLIKPQTFMNLSGESIRAYMDYFKLPLDDLIVLYDDMDTPLGQLRLRYKGSAGGHNGIKSIIQHIGTQEFKRIRIGISRPPEGIGVIDYVLQDFHKQEQEQIKQVLDDICDAVAMACVESFDKVMARYNGKK